MLDQVAETIQAHNLLDPQKPVLAGVSGGPDSSALLHVLCRLGFRVTAAYFDHGLRPDGAAEADFVRRLAASLGAGFVQGKGDVAGHRTRLGRSIEESARQLRYAFLFQEARRIGAQAVASAHTADDQVETILMHMLRGAGLSGLKGMLPRTLLPEFDPRTPLVRPVLQVWRREVLAYCLENGLSTLQDPSNQDTALFRNRIRHELVPLLETYTPGFRERLVDTSQVLARDEELLEQLVEKEWPRVVARQSAAYIGFSLPPLAALPAGLQARLLRRAIFQLAPEQRDVDFDTTRRALSVVPRSARADGQQDLVAGLRIFREEETLWVCRAPEALPTDRWPQLERPDPLAIVPPARVRLAGGWRLEAIWLDGPPQGIENNPNPYFACLSLARPDAALSLRARRPGDRFRPMGMQGAALKLSDFMINAGLPRRARALWPLVCVDHEIAWVPGLRIGENFRVGTAGQRFLGLRCAQGAQAG